MGKDNFDFDFDLQLFADGGTGDAAGDSGGGKDAGEGKPSDSGKKTPTDKAGADNAEDTAAKEAELQKKIDDAVAKAQKKWEKEYQKKAEAEKKEAERLSKLSEEERRKAELESKEQELAAKEKEYQRNILKLEMVKVLTERSIPVEFMDYFITDDSESTLKRITDFEKQYKKAIKDAVDEKLKGRAPAAGAEGGQAGNGNPAAGVKNGFFDAITKNQSKR